MSSYGQNESDFNFAGILAFLLRYKWPILGATLVAGILAAIFSMPFFIPPKFESSVILYPSTTNSISKAILSSNPADKMDVLAFGEEEEAEQILQILQSDDITRRIIDKYNLMDHYRIDKDGSYPYTKLVKKFQKNVNYRRTEYMSIEISVMDENPDTAAHMANDIAALVDSTKNKVQRVRAQQAFEIVKKQYEEKEAFIDNMVDSLQKLGELGVFSYDDQSAALSEGFANALIQGNQNALRELEKQRIVLGRYGPVQKSLIGRIDYDTDELAQLRTKYEQAKVDAEQNLPATFIINHAVPAERKSYPVRSLIVAIAMLSAMALSILYFAFKHNYQAYILAKNAETGRNNA
ncbi:MAG: Wzz/FepE/Etk N-terminal domain-containing protein [Bacteroidia bacterium]